MNDWRKRFEVARAEAHLAWVTHNLESAAAVDRAAQGRGGSVGPLRQIGVLLGAQFDLSRARKEPLLPPVAQDDVEDYNWLGCVPVVTEFTGVRRA